MVLHVFCAPEVREPPNLLCPIIDLLFACVRTRTHVV